ncbi:MAG: hypothetical protein JWO22_3539 [Frankiales bacterium]|nr:hypothetical protein [Frankiales bacterium]
MYATSTTLYITESDARRVEAEIGDLVPDGLVVHVAGPSPDGGWQIIDVWETEAQCNAFRTQQLVPAVARATEGSAGPAQPSISVEINGVLERRPLVAV